MMLQMLSKEAEKMPNRNGEKHVYLLLKHELKNEIQKYD